MSTTIFRQESSRTRKSRATAGWLRPEQQADPIGDLRVSVEIVSFGLRAAAAPLMIDHDGI